jgi:heptosyltransferase II
MKKICIIKLRSAGDVLRTTPILRVFPDCDVSWITDRKSYPFLEGNPLVRNIFFIDNLSEFEKFDELYNFDEDEAACKMAEDIPAGIKKGYGLRDGRFYPFDNDSQYAYRMTKDDALKFKINKKTYQQIIFEMAGMRWKGEDYVLNYAPNNKITRRMCMNYMVGETFPNKLWNNWRDLVSLVPDISVQINFVSPRDYMNWISSCSIIVTSDSLGMHIGLALKKKVIALFGETSMREIEMYGRGIKLSACLACSPCYKKEKCPIKPSCMDMISAQDVLSAISWLSGEKCKEPLVLEII